ncbi:hypothetical protein A1O7_00750 [Cladophialophora yegresii CBS 114405]|uniref:Family A G protein-coupled receptor-like protein n=1 Tax=Cladophialophora yegresii CBS 114405 TaxID=1182544 RepID=W9X1P8_9EURO|nr:uncharacterized protein A1O7_00750 [Cladophialophora yegresii CBS 114405]EXJ64414.1 hypothetical protein A1O7_00750 [Cladophialophora yegresii CBS 114405]
MGNDVFRHNGFTNTVTTNNHITVRGSDWYWTVCAVMTVSAFGFMIHSYFKPRSQRLFHYLNATVCLIAAISYFCMGANLGWTAIQVEWMRSSAKVAGNMRQIFYVRYIDWFITTPLIVVQLLLVAGLPTPTILYTLLMTEVVVVNGLVGALVKSSYKWGFFTFGAVAFFFVAFAIAWDGRAYARVLGVDVLRIFNILAAWTILLWTVYPVIWGVSEGGNIIAPDSEAVSYGVLDLLTKPVFGAVLIWGLRNVDLARLGIHVNDAHPRIPRAEPAPRTEKDAEAAAASNGATATTPATTTATAPETAV